MGLLKGVSLGFLLTLPLLTHAQLTPDNEKFALVLGGGGEPPGDSTIFDQSTAEMVINLKDAHYQTDIAFDGGHAKGFEEVQQALGSSNVDTFNLKAANDKISALKEKIEDKKNSRGQFLVVINTHGAAAERTGANHWVSTINHNENLDLSALTDLQQAAERNHVHLTIVDLSCHSGASLNLARKSQSTCVITGSSAETLGSMEFSDLFSKNLKSGMTMESIFFNSRNQGTYSFPEISTKEGLLTYDELETLHGNVNQGLIYHLARAYKDGKDIAPSSVEPCSCEIAKSFNARVDELLKAVGRAYPIDPRLIMQLKESTENYRNTLKQAMDDDDYMFQTVMVANHPVMRNALLKLDDFLSNTHKVMGLPNTPAELKASFQKILDIEPELRKARDDLLANDERVKRYLTVVPPNGERPAMNLPLMEAARKVSAKERYLYGQLYEAHVNSSKKKGKEPCRDFVL